MHTHHCLALVSASEAMLEEDFLLVIIFHTFPLMYVYFESLNKLRHSQSQAPATTLTPAMNHVNLSCCIEKGIHDCCLNQNPHCFSRCHSLTPTICSNVDILKLCHWQDINGLFPTLKTLMQMRLYQAFLSLYMPLHQTVFFSIRG